MAADKPVTLGVPFGEGDYDAGTEFVVQKSGGEAIATQWNELATWRTDGSILHGVLTFLTPDAGSNSGTYRIVTGISETGTAISKQDIVDGGFDATVSVTISGTTHTLSAADLLSGAVTPVLDYTHFSGPLCSSYVLGAFLRDGATPHPHLFVLFEIRGYEISGSVSKVRCSITLDNRTATSSGIQDYTASALSMTIGASTVRSETNFTLYTDRHYRHMGWYGTDPAARGYVTGPYVQSTKLMPKLRDDLVQPTEATLAGLISSYDWNDTGPLNGNESGGGSHEQIGFGTKEQMLYLLSSDTRALDSAYAFNDIYGLATIGGYSGFSTSGAWCVRDETTGLPFDFENRPYYGPYEYGAVTTKWEQRTTTGGVGTADEGTCFNVSHGTAMTGCLEYLLTADYFPLEMAMFYANCGFYGAPYKSDVFTQTWPRTLIEATYMEHRRFGWALNQAAHTAAIVPDNHSMRTYFIAGVSGQPTYMRNTLGYSLDAGIDGGALGHIYGNAQAAYIAATGSIRPWMDDYVCYALARCCELGWDTEYNTADLLQWKSNYLLERLSDGSNGFCINNAGDGSPIGYNLAGDRWYSISEMQTVNYGNPASCNYVDGGIGDDDQVELYANYALGCLGAVASVGVTGASAAWTRALAAKNPSGYTPQDEANLPKWCVGNRNATTIPSWASDATVGTVIEIPGTAIGDIDLVKPVPLPKLAGNEGADAYGAIISAWSGGCLGEYDGEIALFVHGGGHGDYAGNEVYALKLESESCTWERISENTVSANLVNNAMYHLDGKPNISHTRDTLAYLNNAFWKCTQGGVYYDIATSYDLNRLDLATLTWDADGVLTDHPSGGNGVRGSLVADTNRNILWHFRDSIGTETLPYRSYDPLTNSWTQYSGTYRITAQESCAAFSASRDEIVFYNNGIGSIAETNVIDLSDLTANAVDLGAGSGSPPSPMNGLTWDEGRQKYVALGSTRTTVHELNPSTWTWSTDTYTAIDSVPTNADNRVFGRFRYVPEFSGYVYVSDITGPTYFYRSH